MNNKKLHRKAEGQMICGVCTGLAEYFDADVTLVRLIAVAAGLFTGVGVIAYIAAAVIMPVE
jgi:phage shock protein PspC (stress-responsive transcriptional regulator)